MISGWRSCMKRNAFFQLIHRNGKMYLKSVSGYKWGKDTAYRRCDLLFGQEKD